MFGVSFPELIVVFMVALLIFGPDKLPELARTVGRFSAQFRRQSDSLRREFYNTVYQPTDDFKSSIKREVRSLVTEAAPVPLAAEEVQTCLEPKTEALKEVTELPAVESKS